MQTLDLNVQPTVADLTAPIPEGTFAVTLALITPDMALELVEKHHDDKENRARSMASVEAYKHDMTHGMWLINGDTIRLSCAGEVLDGQHRLWGLANAKGNPLVADGVPLLFIKGISKAAQETMDGGRKRSAADQYNIGKADADKIGSKLMSALRALYLLSSAEGGKLGGGKLTTPQLHAMARMHPKLADSVKLVNATAEGQSDINLNTRPAVLAAIHYAASHIIRKGLDGKALTKDEREALKAKANAFVQAFKTLAPTAGYTGEDPAWKLATLWTSIPKKGRISENDALKLLAKAWDAYRDGDTIPVKQWKEGLAVMEGIGITRKDVTGEEPEAKPEAPAKAEAPKADAKPAKKAATKGKAKAPAKAPEEPSKPLRKGAEGNSPKKAATPPKAAPEVEIVDENTPGLKAAEKAALAYLIGVQAKGGDQRPITRQMIAERVAEVKADEGPQTV